MLYLCFGLIGYNTDCVYLYASRIVISGIEKDHKTHSSQPFEQGIIN
jgi:hypothetical protein